MLVTAHLFVLDQSLTATQEVKWFVQTHLHLRLRQRLHLHHALDPPASAVMDTTANAASVRQTAKATFAQIIRNATRIPHHAVWAAPEVASLLEVVPHPRLRQ